MAEEIYVNAPGKAVDPVPGSAGLNTQLPGQATTGRWCWRWCGRRPGPFVAGCD